VTAAHEQLLTGRRLVLELARLGVGQWTPDAVRQWIREEPPCPIAQAANRGQPHRYLLADVLAWLLARARSGKSKGYAGEAEHAQALEAALTRCTTGAAPLPSPPAAPAAAGSPAKPDAFKDPRNWKAHEEARLTKLKADEMEGKLVPVEDLQRALDAQAQAFAGALEALEARLQLILYDDREKRAVMLREQFSATRDTLVLAADLSRLGGEGAAQ
jgi:phage terminase Nu1 subunit (DNA packaging protein)